MNKSKRQAFSLLAAKWPNAIPGDVFCRKPPGLVALVAARRGLGWECHVAMFLFCPPGYASPLDSTRP